MNKYYQKIVLLSNNEVVKNIILVASITLLISFLGFFKEMLVASYFGLSLVLDTFFIAILVPGFIQSVFISSFKSVFIPNYIAETKTGNSLDSFQGTGLLITSVISLAFIIIAFIFTDTYLEFFFSGHNEEYYGLVKAQFYILLPCVFFWGVSSLLSGILNISGEFKLTSFEGIFIPISIIIIIYFFEDYFDKLILAVGTLTGTILAFLFLVFISIKKKTIRIARPNLKNHNAILMFKQIPAKISSGFLTGMNGVIDQFFAAQLIIGSISAINYSLKIPAFLISILVVAITNVLLPKFSKMIMENRENAFKYWLKIIKTLFIAASICAFIGIILSDFLVKLFFERNEFTESDSIVVSNLQQIFLVYTPFTICGMVSVNFLTSMNKNVVMAYISFVAVILNGILDFFLIKYYGVYGIAICTTLVVIIKNIALFYSVIHYKKLDTKYKI
ncbi:putative peptidoglycan lipid II flippase [Maribacter orientalis]|uniref:Putative peptidoglycan lipid II flippase n=1 Tax=Maribacter orientalis TaxID=228957 RepID=A0A1H7SH18_9FLAO|nr:lipid II flippase MurJ [Maribacter orientalis]SEL71981.1 putative peptidoglycan lipid II flippase [Maribacter orientalis]